MVDAERLNIIRLYLAVVGLLLVSLFTGCTAIRQPPSLTDYSDAGVLVYKRDMLAYWGADAQGNEWLGYGGGITQAGLTSGTLLATAGGSPAAPGLALGSALVSWILGIIKPAGHGHLIVQAASTVTAAEGKYFVDKTAAGISTVPTNCMTTFAAALVAVINRERSDEMRLRQALAPVDPPVPGMGKVGLVSGPDQPRNNCGR